MSQSYTAQDIEVLTGLEPVRRRPGMYTDTSRPNHLAHEVDRQQRRRGAGRPLQPHRRHRCYKDGSLEVVDDGRGMPVDIHPKEKVSGVELILTRLHAGGKFSATRATSSPAACTASASRWSTRCRSTSSAGCAATARNTTSPSRTARCTRSSRSSATSARRNTGTTVRFWPDPSYFDSAEIRRAEAQARAQGQGRAVPGPARALHGREDRREGGVVLRGRARAIPARVARGRRVAARTSRSSAASRASRRASTGRWSGAPTAATRFEESYVNLIPTAQGGTHVNGFRTRPDRSGARVLRVPQPAAARPQARARGRLGRRAATCCR